MPNDGDEVGAFSDKRDEQTAYGLSGRSIAAYSAFNAAETHRRDVDRQTNLNETDTPRKRCGIMTGES